MKVIKIGNWHIFIISNEEVSMIRIRLYKISTGDFYKEEIVDFPEEMKKFRIYEERRLTLELQIYFASKNQGYSVEIVEFI